MKAYLPEYKSQLQHLFLLLISRVRLILRMFRILRSISRTIDNIDYVHVVYIIYGRTESKTSPVGAWSRTVMQRMRKVCRWNTHTMAHAC